MYTVHCINNITAEIWNCFFLFVFILLFLPLTTYEPFSFLGILFQFLEMLQLKVDFCGRCFKIPDILQADVSFVINRF